jgi:hypothetical protein
MNFAEITSLSLARTISDRRVWAASNYWCRDCESLPIALICAGGVVIALLPG